MGRGERQLGDKLGPRIVDLAVQATVAARRQLAPHEARVRAAGTQQLIDRMGSEVAALYRPLTDHLLTGTDVHPIAQDFLQRAASGQDQWQAAAGFLVGSSGVPSSLSTVLSNYLAPAVYAAVRAHPALNMDAASAARSAAIGTTDYQQVISTLQGWGFDTPIGQTLIGLQQAWPSVGVVYDALNRGLISEAQARTYLKRTGLPDQAIGFVLALHTQLLAPADAALAVLRGNMSHEAGVKAARQVGVSAEDFQILIGNTGEPPAVEELLSLWRRGKITTARLDHGVLQSRVRNEWIPEIHELGIIPPTPAEALDALLQGQIPQAEAHKRYVEGGGDPTWFQAAFDSRGAAPTPVELQVMANRGIIPWQGTGPGVTSFHQGFLEGPWRNKWLPAFQRAAEYIPPPREISTLVREGGITETEALRWWQDHGLSHETAVIYWKAAHSSRLASTHALAKGEVERLYHDQAITRAEASTMLGHLGYDAADANYMLEIVDLQRERQYLEQAIRKVNASYVARKISEVDARGALGALAVPTQQIDHLLTLWQLERAATVKTLTVSEVTQAWFYEVISQDAALSYLEGLGYTAFDAWVILSIRAKGPLEGMPAGGIK